MALVRRYPCLYTNEAHKKPQNQRKLDGFLSVHHHNCSAVLWDEDCRTQLKWSFLRGHPGRATHSNGSGGVTPKFKLQEDEEVAFGESHKAWITGPAVEETIQVFAFHSHFGWRFFSFGLTQVVPGLAGCCQRERAQASSRRSVAS